MNVLYQWEQDQAPIDGNGGWGYTPSCMHGVVGGVKKVDILVNPAWIHLYIVNIVTIHLDTPHM